MRNWLNRIADAVMDFVLFSVGGWMARHEMLVTVMACAVGAAIGEAIFSLILRLMQG